MNEAARSTRECSASDKIEILPVTSPTTIFKAIKEEFERIEIS